MIVDIHFVSQVALAADTHEKGAFVSAFLEISWTA